MLVGQPAAARDNQPDTMRFEWRVEGPAAACGSHCRTWISATGVITEDTARTFEAFAHARNVRGHKLVLDSEGGSVLAALALGRTIRKYDMTTTVGRTTTVQPVDKESPRAILTHDASCESMCVFLLLAGTRRYVPTEARVLVHQIWLGAKSKRAREVPYTADELQLVQRDIGRLVRYAAEMGGSMELIETALRVPPWEPMHRLTVEELRRMRITTVDHLYGRGPSLPSVATVSGNTFSTSARGQRKD